MESVFVTRQWADVAPIFLLLLLVLISFTVIVVTAIKILVFCKIFSKAGYSWAIGLLVLIPVATLIMVLFLAFADWPVRRELGKLKQQVEKSKV